MGFQLDIPLLVQNVLTLRGGMNTKDHPSSLQDDQAEDITNYLLKKSALAEKREGITQIADTIAGTQCFGLGDWNEPSGSQFMMAALGSSFYRWDGSASSWSTMTGATSGGDELVRFVQVRTSSPVSDHLMFAIQPNATVYSADMNSVAMVAQNDAPRGVDGIFWLQRLWIADEAGVIHASSVGDPTSFDSSRQYKVDGTRNNLRRIFNFLNNGILVFNSDNIWVVDVDPISLFSSFDATSIFAVNHELGAISAESVVQAGKDWFFLSRHGIHRLSKTEQDRPLGLIVPISDSIEQTIDRINWIQAHKSAAVVWQNLYMIAVPLDSATENSHVLVYDIREDSWSIFDTWDPRVFLKSDISGFERIYFGNSSSSGKVYEAFSGNTDDGSDINSTLSTKRFDFGAPQRFKLYDYIEISVETAPGSDVEVQVQIDGGGYQRLGILATAGILPTLPVTLPFSLVGGLQIRERFPLDFLGQAQNIQFKLISIGSEKITISNLTLAGWIEEEQL